MTNGSNDNSSVSQTGYRVLTSENWLHPDPIMEVFYKLNLSSGDASQMSANDFVEAILKLQLSSDVPLDLIQLMEAARGGMIYGYYFYPLFTLGVEQVYRVAEAAVKAKCVGLGMQLTEGKKQRPKNLHTLIEELGTQGVLTPGEVQRWHTIREIRNQGSHPKQQTVIPPAVTIALVQKVVDDINSLWLK